MSQFSAIIPGAVYAFLGTSRQLNVAPEAALSLLLGQAVTEILRDMDIPHGPKADGLAFAIASVITMQVRNLSSLPCRELKIGSTTGWAIQLRARSMQTGIHGCSAEPRLAPRLRYGISHRYYSVIIPSVFISCRLIHLQRATYTHVWSGRLTA
jgi:hypothetical protein